MMETQPMLVLGIAFSVALNGVILVLVVRLMLAMPEGLRDKVHKIASIETALLSLVEMQKDHEERLRSVERKTDSLPFVKLD